jgi:hypothetical protein
LRIGAEKCAQNEQDQRFSAILQAEWKLIRTSLPCGKLLSFPGWLTLGWSASIEESVNASTKN